MTVLVNEEELAFLRMGSLKVKLTVFGFAATWKKSPELQNPFKTPWYVYLLNTAQR